MDAERSLCLRSGRSTICVIPLDVSMYGTISLGFRRGVIMSESEWRRRFVPLSASAMSAESQEDMVG